MDKVSVFTHNADKRGELKRSKRTEKQLNSEGEVKPNMRKLNKRGKQKCVAQYQNTLTINFIVFNSKKL